MIYLLIFAGDLVLLFFLGKEFRMIAEPALAAVSIFLCLWCLLQDRDGSPPLIDSGIFCALATLVYTVYPLINFWAGDLSFGILSDNRLMSMELSPAEVGHFHWRHVLYLLCFSVVYFVARGRAPIGTGDVEMPDRQTVRFLVILFIVLSGYFIVLQALTGASLEYSYSELESVVAIRAQLPLVIMQVSPKLFGTLFIVKLALLYVVIMRCESGRWKLILCVWIFFELIHAILLKGARTQIVLFIFASILFYHRIVKPLNLRIVFLGGVIFLLSFVLFGFFRSQQDLEQMMTVLDRSDSDIFTTALTISNEFQSLLGTAYDVMLLKQSGTEFPWYLYLNDFITILPPQQIMPFEKIGANEWYLRTIGLSGTGIGLMWGVISQSLAGFDWLELGVRGGVLGYTLALLHRWYVRKSSGFLATLLYIFLCLKVYYTFRDTTFSLLQFLVWEVIPFYFLVKFGPGLIPRIRFDATTFERADQK
jgi:hypothetical protein